jgi:hypothetical protein
MKKYLVHLHDVETGNEKVPYSSVRSFLVADYFDPMVTTFYGTDVLFWKRVMDEKYIVHLQDVALWMKK